MGALTEVLYKSKEAGMPYESVVNAVLTVSISTLPHEDSQYTIEKMLEATQAAAQLCGVEFDYGMIDVPNNKDLH
jgi:hypothetical protein